MASRYFRSINNARPIIVRRARRAPREFRPVNAQWKVAYADFATAMMAFFMLLWLMSTSEKVSLQGLADYFAPSPATISSSSGSGSVLAGAALGPDGAKSNGSFNPDLLSAIPRQRAALGYGASDDNEKHAAERAAAVAATAYASDLRTALAETPALSLLTEQVIVEPTEDGVRIQLMDSAARPMFRSGTAEPYPHAAALLRAVAAKIGRLPTRVAIEGHTDNRTAAATTNWQLSADRAVAARRILAAAGMSEDRFAAVSGRAASDPLFPDEPARAENRRITIILLNEPPAAAPGFGRRAAQALSSQNQKPAS